MLIELGGTASVVVAGYNPQPLGKTKDSLNDMSAYVRLERDLDNLCIRFYSNPFGPMFNKLSKSLIYFTSFTNYEYDIFEVIFSRIQIW